MISQKILPSNKRLDRNQLLELEGFKLSGSNSLINDKSELLLYYHKALLAAEAELNKCENYCPFKSNMQLSNND